MASQDYNTLIEKVRARPELEEITPEAWRADMERSAKAFSLPDGVRHEPVDAGGVPAEWVTPEGADTGCVLLYFHGGGYVVGSPNSHRHLVARLAQAAGIRALSVDYRMGPETPFPGAVDDAVTAYQWLLGQGVDAGNIVMGGDSAGGGLTVAALVSLRDAGVAMPAAAACLSPWTDLEITGPSIKSNAAVDPSAKPGALHILAKWYLGGADARHPLASPIHADLKGLPPMLIQVGSVEILLDDSTRLAEKAKADGVDVELEIWDDMLHVWQYYAPMIPEGRAAVEKIGNYLRDKMA